ncbi:unnamed protein product, partial [Discosporangium mesarthrocarpum]
MAGRVLSCALVARGSDNGLVQTEALRALGFLAGHRPFQPFIIDNALKDLLRLAVDQEGDREVRGIATRALQALGFDRGRQDLALAGNDPRLLKDWFEMERSLEVQHVAEREIWLLTDLMWVRSFASEDCLPLTTPLPPPPQADPL